MQATSFAVNTVYRFLISVCYRFETVSLNGSRFDASATTVISYSTDLRLRLPEESSSTFIWASYFGQSCKYLIFTMSKLYRLYLPS